MFIIQHYVFLCYFPTFIIVQSQDFTLLLDFSNIKNVFILVMFNNSWCNLLVMLYSYFHVTLLQDGTVCKI